MNELIGRVAVVIGAARGVGRSLAVHAAREGMCVVIADVNEEALRLLARRLRKWGAEVVAVPTDVSRADAVAALARQTIEAFGAVHLLFNCASIGGAGTSWDATRTEWEAALNVKLWGTIYSIQEFVPLMLAQGTAGHIVNAVSPDAFLPLSPSAPSQSANAAVVALTENLEHRFRWLSSPLHASVLCRSWLSESTSRRAWARQIADAAFDGIRDHELYIVTESAFVDAVRERFDSITAAHRR